MAILATFRLCGEVFGSAKLLRIKLVTHQFVVQGFSWQTQLFGGLRHIAVRLVQGVTDQAAFVTRHTCRQ